MLWHKVIGAGAGAGAGTTSVTFSDIYETITTGTVFTHSGVSLGAAETGRVICVNTYGNSTGEVTATIGGVSMTRHLSLFSSLTRFACFTATVNTGTSADIVITYGSSGNYSAAAVWSVYGGVSATPVDILSDDGSQDTSSVTLSTDPKSVILASGLGANLTGGITWTGVTEEDETSSGNRTYGAGSSVGSFTNETITAVFDGAGLSGIVATAFE